MPNLDRRPVPGRRHSVGLVLAVVSFLHAAGLFAQNGAPADVILVHGKIITMDTNDGIVEALAIDR